MFEPDEYIFTKLARYFKNLKKKQSEGSPFIVHLNDIKTRLTLIARALTGEPIEIFEAIREGGYKNENFFLPKSISFFDSIEDNISFYIFRVLYLSTQKKLQFNWTDDLEHELLASQTKANETSNEILALLWDSYPISKQLHDKFVHYFLSFESKKVPADYTFLYGKWMKNTLKTDSDNLKNFSNDVKSAQDQKSKTIIKSNAVEEIISAIIDEKQLEDATTQHQFEKVETADEFGGNWRDMDGEDDLEDHANALESLNMKYTVRVDEMTHSVYQTDFIENTTISESAHRDLKGYHISYDEWDYATRQYKPDYCKVYPKTILKTNAKYYNNTIQNYRSTLVQLRKMLSTVNNKYKEQRRQNQGPEFDLDAITDLYVDISSGHSPSENIYISKRKKEKDLSILLLLDSSLSSDGYTGGNKVIDVEKQVSILFGTILEEYNIDFSIQSFYSKTRNQSTYVTVKAFDESWSIARNKIGAIEPNGYTRIGAALRHSGAILNKRDSQNKWIILLSDGKPNDYDRYEGKYGVNDIKQALRELNQQHINTYALAIEAEAKFYLPQMFGQSHYQILNTPKEMISALVHLFEKIKYGN